MLSRDPSESSHWSKDFVEHLRTVHFALIAASTAVILAAASVKPYSPATAVRQVNEIIELQRLWSPEFVVERLMDMAADNRAVNEYFDPDYIDPLSLLGDPNYDVMGALGTVQWTNQHRKSEKSVVFVFPKLMLLDGKGWQMQGPASAWTALKDPTKTLTDFQWWWDSLLQSPSVLIPRGFSRKAILYRTPPLSSFTLLPEKSQSDAGSGYALLMQLDTPSAFNPSLPRVHLLLLSGSEKGMAYWASFIDENSTVQVNIPIVTYWEVQLTQQKLAKCFPNWQLGRFDRSFSDLAQAARGLEALELEDVKRIVSEDAARGREVLEVFGLKFPVGRVTFWSTVVLLCIQLYFFVYLKQLSGKLAQTDAGWDVPWIGMDQSLLARCLLFTTTVLLPCISLGLWGVLTSFHQWDRWVAVKVFGFIGSLILGVLCWLCRPQLKKASTSGEQPNANP